jgi:hypothetical protein
MADLLVKMDRRITANGRNLAVSRGRLNCRGRE